MSIPQIDHKYVFRIIIHNLILKPNIFNIEYDEIRDPAIGVRLFNFPVFVLYGKILNF